MTFIEMCNIESDHFLTKNKGLPCNIEVGVHVFFYICNQFISNQGSGFLKIKIEYNGLLLC